jgi:hypothetical protein
MGRGTNFMVGMGLIAVGTVFMMSLAFNIMPQNVAIFIGCACYVLSGFAFAFLPRR